MPGTELHRKTGSAPHLPARPLELVLLGEPGVAALVEVAVPDDGAEGGSDQEDGAPVDLLLPGVQNCTAGVLCTWWWLYSGWNSRGM